MCTILVVLLAGTLGTIAQPSLDSFSLSLTPPELLTLTFDTALTDPSCDVSKLTLQNSSTLIIGGSYSPLEGSCSFIGGLTVTLNMTLSSSDWANTQANIYLATSSTNAYLSLQAGFLTEDSNSPISSSAALPVTHNLFLPNTNPPSVVASLLDLNGGIMTLRLYEGSTYTASAPILFTDSMGNVSEVTLSEFLTPNSVVFIYELPVFLLHSIKLASPPYFVSLPPALFEDSAGMTSPAQSAIAVTVVPDVTPPAIISFAFDLDSGQLDLTFDEPVNLDSVNLTDTVYLTNEFQGSADATSISVIQITSESPNTELSLVLSISTLNSVKFDTILCTSSFNCLLNVKFSAFSDTTGNGILALSSNIVAHSFINDVTQPELISYSINFASSSIALTFNEPIDPPSFDPSGVALDSVTDVITSGDNPIQHQPVSLSSSNVDVTEEGTVIRIKIETSSLMDLIWLVDIGNTTCTVEDFTAHDTSGNPVIPIPPSVLFQPSQIIFDHTPPTLLEFIAKPPETHQLMFIFSEAVDITTWNISALTLILQTAQGVHKYTFSGGNAETDTGRRVTFIINSSEFVFSALMEHYQEAYVNGSLAVTTSDTLVEDLFGNPLKLVIQPLLYNTSISGDIPELLTVDFDLNTGKLDLTFSALVVVSFPAGRIQFQNSAILPNHILTLANNGSYISSDELRSSLSFTLDSKDLNRLKLIPFLATSSTNTFVVLAENFAYGLGTIPLAVQNGTQVRGFITDTEGPGVISFELDLDSDSLFIEFNEPVSVPTFDESHIILLNSTTLPLSEAAHVSLTSVFVLAQGNVTYFRALISVQDAVDIKRQPLCFSVENCFVMFDESLVTDVRGNIFLTTLTPAQVDGVSPDVTPPQLLSFPTFDLDSGLFTLIFSEPVNGSSADYTDVQFSNAPLNFSASVTLSEGFTSPDHIEIDFHMSHVDLNSLKSNLDLCTTRDNCWIRLPSFFITDIGMNPFIHSDYQSNVAASFHQPIVFIPDQTSPELAYVSMDLNQGKLTLSFTEVIVAATFAPKDVTLLHSPSSPLSLTLSSDTIFSLSSLGTVVSLQLTTDDLNWLKARNLFTSVIDSYLSLATKLSDVSGNEFLNISRSVGFQVNEVIPDSTRPHLVYFDNFNLENNSFIISFDEPVNISMFNVTQVVLVSQPSEQASVYTLTGAALVSALDDSLQRCLVVLTSSDRVQIKLLTSLGTMQINTYIILNGDAISDTSGNTNTNTLPILLSIAGYIPDTSKAGLLDFGLDLDSALLFLTFDDVIESTSVQPTSLILQDKASNPTSSYKLTHFSTSINGSSDQLIISLSHGDLLALKLDLNLATSASDTYISIDSDFATDIEGRAIIAIPPTSALPLTSSLNFFPDTTSPSVSSFSLDMNTGILQISFSEPILPSSIDPSQLFLHSQKSGGGSSHNLGQTTSLLTTTAASLNVELGLLQSDLNILKDAQGLAVGIGTTFMSFTSRFVTDVSGNFIMAIAADNSIPATRFTIDTTAPELWGFDADLTPVAKLYLTFSETIRLNGLIQITISIMNAPVNPSVTISLTEADESRQTGLNRVEISLSPAIITQLLVDTIARSVDSLYLSLMQGVVVDTTGNPVTPTDAYRVEQLYKSCFSNTYNNATLGECLACPSECGGSCTGPATVVGSGGCESCNTVLLDREGSQLTCTDPTTSTCPLGFFSTSLSSLTSSLPPTITESTLLCQQCHSLCSSCDGPTASNCQTCRSAFFTNISTARVECIHSCGNDTSVRDCVTCHDQCYGCTGPSNRDCIICREDSVLTAEGQEVCVPTCSGSMYLSQDNGAYTCQPCNSECNGCTGSDNTECMTCHNVNLTINSSVMCLTECPPGYYDAAGSCLSCHEFCMECTGPSNKNCTSCVDDEVEGEDGGRECVPICSFGREYDTEDEKCTLTREAFYLSVAAGALGGIILLLLVVLSLSCYCYHLKKRRDKQGVFFVSSSFNTGGQELHSY